LINGENLNEKEFSYLYLATLLLPMLTFAAPVSASTGHPAIGTYNGSGNFIIATTSVNVTAGDMIVDASTARPRRS
jgi:hypothetical protein